MFPMMHDVHVTQGDGSVIAETPNPAVSNSLLQEILQWKEEGAIEQDIHCRLRHHTVPPGYTISIWKPGMFHHNAFTEVL